MMSLPSFFQAHFILKAPLPVLYISFNSSGDATIGALLEKSGPFIYLRISSTEVFGFSKTWIVASITSVILCDGISVAIPTAMPVVPLSKMDGTFAGKITGSRSDPSKFGCQSTVPCFNSSIRRSENFVSLDSVYLIAAKDLGSSCDPQFP